MMEESKIEKALEHNLGQVRPSPDLLGRIHREAERVRPSLWARLRLGPRLELAAACLVLVALVGFAAYRNLYPYVAPNNPNPGPVGGEAPRDTYSGNVSDANLHLLYKLEPTEQGDWVLSATMTNLSRSPMELWPECGNLVRMEGRIVTATCQPKDVPAVVLEPGVTQADEVHFSDEEIRNRTALVVSYSIPGQGPPLTLRTPLPYNPEDPAPAVAAVVETFGHRLQKVSLQASRDQLWSDIQEQYGDLITHNLWARWQFDPTQAPGRLTSSPWPDRIRIIRSDKTAEGTYAVQGEIIEVSSTGPAATRPINLVVERWGEKWLISAVMLGEYAEAKPEPIIYTNKLYRFNFRLPAAWKGYSIDSSMWEGANTAGHVVQTGPLISIRSPFWRAETPTQDIPIQVFTIDQWNRLLAGEFHIGAAPVNPSELGRNQTYVFALPARYNFAFPTGYEEVEEILAGNPLQPID